MALLLENSLLEYLTQSLFVAGDLKVREARLEFIGHKEIIHLITRQEFGGIFEFLVELGAQPQLPAFEHFILGRSAENLCRQKDELLEGQKVIVAGKMPGLAIGIRGITQQRHRPAASGV